LGGPKFFAVPPSQYILSCHGRTRFEVESQRLGECSARLFYSRALSSNAIVSMQKHALGPQPRCTRNAVYGLHLYCPNAVFFQFSIRSGSFQITYICKKCFCNPSVKRYLCCIIIVRAFASKQARSSSRRLGESADRGMGVPMVHIGVQHFFCIAREIHIIVLTTNSVYDN
jgi:hypothetical protein